MLISRLNRFKIGSIISYLALFILLQNPISRFFHTKISIIFQVCYKTSYVVCHVKNNMANVCVRMMKTNSTLSLYIQRRQATIECKEKRERTKQEEANELNK